MSKIIGSTDLTNFNVRSFCMLAFNPEQLAKKKGVQRKKERKKERN
jgi:hypothetical protein